MFKDAFIFSSSDWPLFQKYAGDRRLPTPPEPATTLFLVILAQTNHSLKQNVSFLNQESINRHLSVGGPN